MSHHSLIQRRPWYKITQPFKQYEDPIRLMRCCNLSSALLYLLSFFLWARDVKREETESAMQLLLSQNPAEARKSPDMTAIIPRLLSSSASLQGTEEHTGVKNYTHWFWGVFNHHTDRCCIDTSITPDRLCVWIHTRAWVKYSRLDYRSSFVLPPFLSSAFALLVHKNNSVSYLTQCVPSEKGFRQKEKMFFDFFELG